MGPRWKVRLESRKLFSYREQVGATADYRRRQTSSVWDKILDSHTGTHIKKFSLRPEIGRPWEIRDTK